MIEIGWASKEQPEVLIQSSAQTSPSSASVPQLDTFDMQIEHEGVLQGDKHIDRLILHENRLL